MAQRPEHNQHMHNLMARAPHIESPRKPPLRNPDGVHDGACKIEQSETDEVVEGHAFVLPLPAVKLHAVDTRAERGGTEEGVKDEAGAAGFGAAEEGNGGYESGTGGCCCCLGYRQRGDTGNCLRIVCISVQ